MKSESTEAQTDRKTDRMCPLMGPTGKMCNTSCAWYIQGKRGGCAIAVIARDIGGR